MSKAGVKRGPYKVRARSGNIPERFWQKVDYRGVCWLWLASTDALGYGRFQYASHDSRLAHRVAWELAVGPIPTGLHVCHRCDNPPCVNPAHLFLGTDAHNARDRDRKGRLGDRRGSANGHARLTDQDVRAIRAARGHITAHALAAEYGVVRSMISHIWTRRAWTHLD